ncbi:hypothetical protein L6164_027494 [Bauhinia variegata]|uniref:Uncharacterized protein n=1 Tax=Bauhinia variegata TaxID=167791 RepID=A0ACB9LT59_BAUVA|nr:hypothetical protein L6164_027494 [Bauhinia variegata]
MPFSSPLPSVTGRSVADSIQRLDTPAMTSISLPVGLSSHQSFTQLDPADQTAASQVAGHPSFSTSMYWQGQRRLSSDSSQSLPQSSSLQPPSTVSPLVMLMQNQMQTLETQAPANLGRTTLLEHGIPTS